MVGYLFYYENEDVNKDEKVIVFSLDSISASSVLTELLMVVETTQLGLSDEFSYKFCDQILKVCEAFRSIPEIQTIVLDYDGFCKLVSQSDVIIDSLSYDSEITKKSAIQKSPDFL